MTNRLFSRRALFVYLAALLCTAFFLNHTRRTRDAQPIEEELLSPSQDDSKKQLGGTDTNLGALPTIPERPKITIIAIWNPKTNNPKDPIYLPNFFASVAANPSIELLFIKYDKYEVGCQTPFAPDLPNVKEICLATDEYWKLHAKFLCDYWRGCSDEEHANVLKKLYERAGKDYGNSYFRPFRPEIFHQWVNPHTAIWAWCDMDIFMGDFERNFPWDVAGDFDFLWPSPPQDSDDILVFFPGHLAFFKRAPHVIDEFMRLPNFRSLEAFMDLPWLTSATEECEYSHWALTQSSLTFLRFPGMVESGFHFSTTNRGVFSIENPGFWDLSLREMAPENREMRVSLGTSLQGRKSLPPPLPTFTRDGKENEVVLHVGEYTHVLWFPQQYAVNLLVDETKTLKRPYKRYLMRREPHGPVYDRSEPVGEKLFAIPQDAYAESPDRSAPMLAWELLYSHFQSEKYSEMFTIYVVNYKDWWGLPGVPTEGLAPDQVLFVDQRRGSYIWNSTGHIVFSARV
ncbi:hypothetical protein PC9H_006472 [Pleurotus ostreatus]|uniref:Uncharacterized protein n=1 Tax=Pleurotus ostreatus TaxID=5322 RepID=A0A8H6ZTS6_PLEOS|nr:uncharacterized protein PC9H_006472 [Pleurotus ostreatus]KAF7430761.1 hypothetical protein PC9H_006472 [Pleurotus ostreatus]